jgi:hypothetical protein
MSGWGRRAALAAGALALALVPLAAAAPPSLGPLSPTTADATGPGGANVSYSVGVGDDTDPSPSVSCSPSSGSLFPIGTTTIDCTATDVDGESSSASFGLTVRDATNPVLSVPGDVTTEATGPGGASVSFSASATDWSSVGVSCSPGSGSTFPLGTTTVNCTATDSQGNSSSGSFQVTVRDTTAPTLALPGAQVAEATSASGADVSYPAPGASDAVDTSPTVSCAPPSGSQFGLGSTNVACTASDDAGNSSSGSFGVTVQDTTAPTLSLPSALTVEANGPGGSTVAYSASASDLGAALLGVSCAPASGATFPLGTTAVTCHATDGAGNTANGSFSVKVRDTTAPTLVTAPITVAATVPAGIRRTDPDMAAYLRSFRASDLVSGPVLRTNAPDLFPVGVTPLEVRATDAAGNTASRTVRVTVLPLGKQAPPPPDLTPPGDVTNVRATPGNHRVTLDWRTPAKDVATVEVRVSNSSGGGERVVYRGAGARAVAEKLRNDEQYRFVLVTLDESGNRSKGVVVVAVPKALLLAAPKPGAKVRTPPLLRWVPITGVRYYNVQLYRGKAKLLSAWPGGSKLQLKRSWTFERTKRTLGPGTYTWYVWPGLGPRSEARYGPMLGKSTFVVAG